MTVCAVLKEKYERKLKNLSWENLWQLWKYAKIIKILGANGITERSENIDGNCF